MLPGGDKVSVDSRGYYATLGLNPGASIEAIRQAYRRIVKDCHPDTSTVKDGGQRFRRITEAYETLSENSSKAAYDAEVSAPQPEVASAAQEIPEPVRCEVCGKVTAQARRLVFWRITSFIFATHKSPVQKIFCRVCAAKEQLKSTIWTSLLGWWGIPWGPVWSIGHGVTNAVGGTREVAVDESLMCQNAIAFAFKGEGAIAIGLSNLLRKSENTEIAHRAADIISFFTERGFNPTTTMKDAWSGSFVRNAMMLLVAFAVPGAALAFVYLAPAQTAFVSAPYGSSPSSESASNSFDAVFGPEADAAGSGVNDAAPEPPVPTCATMPSNGELLADNRVAEGEGHVLHIDNGTAGDAIIKLRDSRSNQTVVSFFVGRGQGANLANIPDGSYTIQYAVGDALAEDCQSFPKGRASADQFPGPNAFTTRYEEDALGTSVISQRLTYTLYAVPGGNTRPKNIRMDEFDKL